ncbi:MAG: ATP-binding protein [Pseudomonadota bacterium]
MSIRVRLILMVLCVAVPCAAAMAWAVEATYRRERSSITQSLRETTRALALAVGRELSAAEAVGRTLAASPDLEDLNLPEFYAQAKKATEPDGGWAVLLDGQRMLVNTSQQLGAVLPTRPPEAERYAKPKDTKVDVSSMFVGTLTGRRAVAITVATVATNGRRYEVSVVVPPERVQRVLDDQRLPDGWMSGVIDQKGVLVARRPDAKRWIGSAASPAMREQIGKHQNGFFRVRSLDGIPSTAFFSRIQGTGWALVISVPDQLLRANANRSMVEAASAAAGMLALALLSAFVVARRLVAPAVALQTAAVALEADALVQYEAQGVSELDAAGSALTLAAAKLKDANRLLEERVAVATAQARDAQQKVEAAQRLEALGRLTGGVAHDVNNLLAVVANSATLLQRRPDDAGRDKRFAAIQRAVADGRALTQKLLSFSRQRRLDPSTLDLRTWLLELLPMVHDEVGEAILVQMEVAADTAPVRVDVTEMRLALLNLASNAGHAMPKGGTLRISAGNSPGDAASDPSVLITVEDTGHGVPDDLRDRIFEPFFTTRGSHGGNGLGLSQVYGFCQFSGGSVRVEGTTEGTAFVLALPAAGPSPLLQPSAALQLSNSRNRLLYVEDNVALGELTKVVLEDMNYRVTWVLNADAALPEVRTCAYDIVLSDFALPGSLNGLELGLRIREEQPKLPFVLLTGYADHGQLATVAGFEVLYKPCTTEELEATLARYVR